MKPAVMMCLVAVVMGGCGGADTEDVSPQELGSAEQSIIWACDGSSQWNRYWYKNGVEVGREYCDCPGILTKFGTTSGSYTQELLFYCSP
ncbi:hypothetical protein [Myxococcus sp. RHSTA-1-4]|uniref:hypothetical protein n=1 Tax=Myxococcus sp. RHSTA-1-4 TaxID=2874601 RepID=UPI001CBC9FB6|nr:hypothetical protein [Myxococcus sp. RHSTA-1-4]MBZ4419308.1 hypothetical protein [Myxococcus sp. RHSTA-1-4]